MSHLRESLKDLSLALSKDWHYVPGLSEENHLAKRIDTLNEAIQQFRPTNSRSGTIGRIATALLRTAKEDKSLTDLLSPSGFLVDSYDALGVLQVRADYASQLGDHEHRQLRSELFAGFRPHTNIIKALPLCIFTHPGYQAPLEDLLDHLAVELYAAKRAGDPEDGAVGWLLRKAIDNLGVENVKKFLAQLSSNLKFPPKTSPFSR